jgi:hypothetical protein
MKSFILVFFLAFLSLESSAKLTARKKKVDNLACKNKRSQACLKALSKVDQNRVKTQIASKELARLHSEIQERKGIKTSQHNNLLKTMQKVSCNMATNNFTAKAYCYDHCLDSDDCQIKNNKKR